MQLHAPLPEGIQNQLPEPPQYVLPFDLNHKGEPIEGYCVVTQGMLWFFEQGDLREKYPAEDCQELAAEQLIGSGSLNARVKGQMTLLCLFSHPVSHRLCGVRHGPCLYPKNRPGGGG